MASSDREYNLEERLCDSIASELLMPEDIFIQEVANRGQTWKELSEIAGIFHVSGEAAINRILDLDLWRAIHIRLRPTTLNDLEEAFAQEWFKPSKSLEQNPIGTVLLVQRIMEWLHSGGSRVFRMKEPCEANLGLGASLQLSGHYFRICGDRFARLLAVIPTPIKTPLRNEPSVATSGQMPLFDGRLWA